MKIVNIETTSLYYPHGKPIQDATIPPPLRRNPEGANFSYISTQTRVLKASE